MVKEEMRAGVELAIKEATDQASQQVIYSLPSKTLMSPPI